MLDEINGAIKEYEAKWLALINGRKHWDFFSELRPTAVGWKVKDRAEYERVVNELRDSSGRIYESWINGRWIAKIILNDIELQGGICIVKIMQRRPDSEDSLGLDHIDFYSTQPERFDEVFRDESDLKVVEERNEDATDFVWTSVWFEGTEAKIKSYTVLGIMADELVEIERDLLRREADDDVDVESSPPAGN